MFSSFKCNRNQLLYLLSVIFIFNCNIFAAEETSQQIIERLQQEAEESFGREDFAGARDRYRQILRDYPEAIASRIGLTRSLIHLGDIAASQTEVNRLLSDYSTHPDIAEIAQQAADLYVDTEHYPEALPLYQSALESWPTAREAIWFQCGLATISLRQEDLETAQAAKDKLLSDYSTDPAFADVVGTLADAFLGSEHFLEAQQLYQTAIANQLSGEDTILYQRGLILSLTQMGDEVAAQREVNKLLSSDSAHPEFAKTVQIAADAIYDTGQYANAQQLYQAAITNQPAGEDAIWSQLGLVLSQIRLNNIEAAKAEKNKLLSDYSTNPAFAEVACILSGAFHDAGHDTEAQQLYQAALESDQIAVDPIGLINAALKLGDVVAAQREVNKLLSEYSGDPELAKTVRIAADAFYDTGHYAKAQQLYQTVISNQPTDEVTMGSYAGIAKAAIRLDSADSDPNFPMVTDWNVDAIVKHLITNHTGSEQLGGHVFEIGEEYYNLAQEKLSAGDFVNADADFQKALTIWKQLIDQIESSKSQAMAAYYSATLYRSLKDYITAAEYYEQVATRWPDYEDSAASLLLSATCYERAGRQVHNEGMLYHEKIQEVCRNLIQRYPSSAYAEKAKQIFDLQGE